MLKCRVCHAHERATYVKNGRRRYRCMCLQCYMWKRRDQQSEKCTIQPKIRTCLMCDEKFWSDWIGHRRCSSCEAKLKISEDVYRIRYIKEKAARAARKKELYQPTSVPRYAEVTR